MNQVVQINYTKSIILVSIIVLSISILNKLYSQQFQQFEEVIQVKKNENCIASKQSENLFSNMFGFGKSVRIISSKVITYSNFPLLRSSQLTEVFYSQQSNQSKDEEWRNANTIYEFSVKDLDEQDVSLDKYKGKVVIIVNVASKCGLTKTNYKELNELYGKYKDKGLSILGFPSNSFAQEPGCSVDIKEFVKKNNVEWDMFAKVDVNGDKSIPLYKWLKTKCGGTIFDAIKWNFTKFLVDRQGVPIARFSPQTNPLDLEEDIKKELEKE